MVEITLKKNSLYILEILTQLGFKSFHLIDNLKT